MKVITRSEWGARRPTAFSQIGQVEGVAVHYSASNADEQADHRNCASRVRAIQDFHMSHDPHDPTKPWADIAYSWLVCKHGFVFQGRGRLHRSAAQGTKDGNDHFLAVCFLGDDTAARDDVTPAGRTAILELVARELTFAGVVPRAGSSVVRPHSSFHPTGCPGSDLRAFVTRLNVLLKG